MFRLRELEIRKYRNVEPTTLRFADGFNVVLGKNATGKTTLLELIAAVVQDDLLVLHNEHDALEIAATQESKEDPQQRLRFEFTREIPQLEQQAHRVSGTAAASNTLHIQGDDQAFQKQWSGSEGIPVEVGAKKRIPLRVSGPRIAAAVSEGFSPLASWLLSGTVFLGRIPGRFDEGLDAFRRLIEVREPMTMTFGLSSTASMAELRELFPASLIPSPGLAEPPKELHSSHKEDAVLRRFVEIAGMSKAFVTADLQSQTPRGQNAIEATYSAPRFLFTSRDGKRRFIEHGLSFGQKRLLTFLYHAAAGGTPPVIADELVNGLHYDWISECIRVLENRQSFLTSQNPILLDRIGVSSDPAEVQRSFVICRSRIVDGRERMFWSNPTEEEARELVRGYSTGIAHASEVLRDMELW